MKLLSALIMGLQMCPEVPFEGKILPIKIVVI